MGPLGTQEMIAIFILALLLFGPKELPKIGKTIGKAMTEFRRAQGELKAQINREMDNLQRESGTAELVASATALSEASYTYENSEFEGDDSDPYYHTPYESGASATEGAGHEAAVPQIEAAAESVPQGHVHYSEASEPGDYGSYHTEPVISAVVHTEAQQPESDLPHAVSSDHVHG